MKFILGRKLNMSQVFTKDGRKIPVTVVEAGPCTVLQVRTEARDGYRAVQLGFGSKRSLNRPQKGHQKDKAFQYLREFRVANDQQLHVGETVSASDFISGDVVNVSGVMKGRGFAGAMKRHGFHGAPASHGHDHPRAVGSIGSRFPQHTLKGTRMAGRMGGHQVTQKHAVIVDVDAKRNLLWISGPVPGSRNGLVKVVVDPTQKPRQPLELYTPQRLPAQTEDKDESAEVKNKPNEDSSGTGSDTVTEAKT